MFLSLTFTEFGSAPTQTGCWGLRNESDTTPALRGLMATGLGDRVWASRESLAMSCWSGFLTYPCHALSCSVLASVVSS